MIDYNKIKNVTFKQIDYMKHAIGFDDRKVKGTKYRRYEPYRNFFDAGKPDIADMEKLVEIGLMTKSRDHWYHVNDDGKKFLQLVTGVEILPDMPDMINITNYEKLDHFVANEFIAVVLDESSILKSYSGKVRNQIINCFNKVPFKLACTATPAPNDYMELGNHSEFLGVMTRAEMLSMFFVHDGGQTSKWRLKGHAQDLFWKWISSWCVVVDNPKKLGYTSVNYELPKLTIKQIIVDGDEPINETLSLTERRNARKESLEMRCKCVYKMLKEKGAVIDEEMPELRE